MSDAERMARAFRTALHNHKNKYDDFYTSGTAGLLVDYTAAFQVLLDAGYQMPPPPRETTVDDNKIGGWMKLTANGDDSGGTMMYAVRGFWHDTNLEAVTEADAINAIVAYVVRDASLSGQVTPIHSRQRESEARQLLAPLGITTETMRPKAKTVRVKCPYYRDKCHSGTCSLCRGQDEYDAVMVEGTPCN